MCDTGNHSPYPAGILLSLPANEPCCTGNGRYLQFCIQKLHGIACNIFFRVYTNAHLKNNDDLYWLDKASNGSILGPAKTSLPSMSDRGKAKETFDFVASNSDVEWLSVTTGREGSSETQTRISTNHREESVSSPREMGDLVDAASTSNLKILEIAHSHPVAQANYPSGFYPSGQINYNVPRGGDRGNAEMVEKGYRKSIVNFNIYVGPTGETIFYNSKKIYR